ncbi:unnamed protein product [Protopolystoma xenopodis]|uniref:CSC1/OSCA1-like cytosolic domain-containing protein n=1 Tax=Protopolystoma xenopodis TaxID=117903 RepID=A0A448XEK1_9PLAT|nr:unnamed protein product [Protopolystoma xenopodis]
MAIFTDGADYDAGETFGNVTRPRFNFGNDHPDNGLRTREAAEIALNYSKHQYEKTGRLPLMIPRSCGWLCVRCIGTRSAKTNTNRPCNSSSCFGNHASCLCYCCCGFESEIEPKKLTDSTEQLPLPLQPSSTTLPPLYQVTASTTLDGDTSTFQCFELHNTNLDIPDSEPGLNDVENEEDDNVQNILTKDPDTLSCLTSVDKLPRVYSPHTASCCESCKPVDAIDFYSHEMNSLSHSLAIERSKAVQTQIGIVFVTFTKQEHAAL